MSSRVSLISSKSEYGILINMLSSIIIIPILVFMVAILGGIYTLQGVAWYHKLKLPRWIPPGGVFGFVWVLMYMLIALSAILFWNSPAWLSPILSTTGLRQLIALLFLASGVLNVMWNYMFFVGHRLHESAIASVAIVITMGILIILIWPVSPFSAVLLFPYATWAAVITAMALAVSKKNPRYA